MSNPAKHHFYLTFPQNVTESQAEAWLAKWGAVRETAEGPTAVLDGELCLPVQASVDLPKLITELPGTAVYDNEQRAELY